MDKILNITLQQQEGQLILHLDGRLDTLGARKLDETLLQLGQSQTRHLLLNMKDITFLSSAGIRILIKYYKQNQTNKGDFSLSNVQPQAEGVLKMVGLEQLILSGQYQEKKFTAQNYTLENISFHLQPLHQEPGLLDKMDLQTESPTTYRPYDLFIGRTTRQQEFIAIGDRLYFETGHSTPSFPPLNTTGSHGAPSHFITFRPEFQQSVPLSTLIRLLLHITDSECFTTIIKAESAGITGFTTQSAQLWLTRLPVHRQKPLLITGIAHLASFQEKISYTEPLLPEATVSGHFHALVNPSVSDDFQTADLNRNLQQLTTGKRPFALFHLTNDSRLPQGCGETHLKNGCAWIVKIK